MKKQTPNSKEPERPAERTCPLCGKNYSQPPAVSRTDNQTLICPDCGTRQALASIGVDRAEQDQILRIIHSAQSAE